MKSIISTFNERSMNIPKLIKTHEKRSAIEIKLFLLPSRARWERSRVVNPPGSQEGDKLFYGRTRPIGKSLTGKTFSPFLLVEALTMIRIDFWSRSVIDVVA